jgi:hypothetical protein
VESFSPQGGWHGRLKEKGPNNIIGGEYGAFGFTVLLRGVGTGVSVEDAMGGTKRIEFAVVKFFAVVTLDGENREVELGAD